MASHCTLTPTATAQVIKKTAAEKRAYTAALRAQQASEETRGFYKESRANAGLYFFVPYFLIGLINHQMTLDLSLKKSTAMLLSLLRLL